MTPNEDINFIENNTYLISNDNYYIKINKDLFLGWNISELETRVNMSYEVLNLCYSILSSLKVLKLLPSEFPVRFEEFFYFCEILGAPPTEKELLTNTLLDCYKKGWKNYLTKYIYDRMDNSRYDFYTYFILWGKICDEVVSFKDTSNKKLIISNLGVFFVGGLLGYFLSVYAFIC
jgi:hypothetical protein